VIGPERGKPYWNPYLAGASLGIIVTVAFAFDHYFGASRVFATLARVLRGDNVSLDHWMTWEIVGIALGAFLGALVARRFGLRWTRGPRANVALRAGMGVLGGALVMIGSRFAAGCTSGLALTGGARMSAGAYVFMGAMFLGGFAAAAVARRLWT